MTKKHWQLQSPISAVIFDCDGTLSTLEGIDELARLNKVSEPVELLTAEAMTSTGINPGLYEKRLELVVPSAKQVEELGKQYFAHQVPDVTAVIRLLKRLNKSVYLVSAGLYPAVKIFGELLNIPSSNIFAVDIQFDTQGNYIDFERTSPLVNRNGKREIVTQLKTHHDHVLYVGDGMNDLVVYDLVTRFVGYGGVFYRENIAAQCQYYIKQLSMAALLPLSLTQREHEQLLPDEQALYQFGLSAIQSNPEIEN